jgi:hypothetical protein
LPPNSAAAKVEEASEACKPAEESLSALIARTTSETATADAESERAHKTSHFRVSTRRSSAAVVAHKERQLWQRIQWWYESRAMMLNC